ncbi:MAG: tyrosine-type recombinase/integrase [Thermoleophilaceae bacterium]
MAVLLEGASEHRALLATAILAGGLRVSELTGLRWRDVNLAAGRLRVAASKTAAGRREVDLSPELRERLAEHRAGSKFAGDGDFVFPTRRGTDAIATLSESGSCGRRSSGRTRSS